MSTSVAFASAARIQGRVIWAIMLREVRARYQGSRLGYAWALIDPLLHLAVWVTIMVVLRHRQALIGDSVLLFIATGLVPFMMFRTVSNFTAGALKANRALLSYPVVLPIDLLLSRWLLECATLCVVAIIIFTSLVLSGQAEAPDHYTGLVAASCCMFLLALGLGIFNGVMNILSELYSFLWSIFSRLLYFTSGIFFIPDQLPLELQYYLWFNPAAHGVEMFRDAYYADFTSNFYYPPYMLAWAVGLFAIGLFLERLVRGKRPGD
jgi:capsular polysaccharide transport system permease protein